MTTHCKCLDTVVLLEIAWHTAVVLNFPQKMMTMMLMMVAVQYCIQEHGGIAPVRFPTSTACTIVHEDKLLSATTGTIGIIIIIP